MEDPKCRFKGCQGTLVSGLGTPTNGVAAEPCKICAQCDTCYRTVGLEKFMRLQDEQNE